MTDCYLCNCNIEDIPFRCKFCGMIFCKKHRLPENHNCPYDIQPKNRKIYGSQKELVNYINALEFMDNEFTVAKVQQYVEAKNLNKGQALDLLYSFIENSDDIEIRTLSLWAIHVLQLKINKAYDILENCLLSDESAEVRNMAADVLLKDYPQKSENLITFALEHDKELNIKKEE